MHGGGVVFSYSHQTQDIYCSYQAGQLSNLHSLTTTNRKLAISICVWSFGENNSVMYCILLRGGLYMHSKLQSVTKVLYVVLCVYVFHRLDGLD